MAATVICMPALARARDVPIPVEMLPLQVAPFALSSEASHEVEPPPAIEPSPVEPKVETAAPPVVEVPAPPALELKQPTPAKLPPRGKTLQSAGGVIAGYGAFGVLSWTVTTLIFDYTAASTILPPRVSQILNIFGYVSLSLSIAELCVGLPMVAVGTARERAYRRASAAQLRIGASPAPGGGSLHAGVSF
jgi:hypothetical protein